MMTPETPAAPLSQPNAAPSLANAPGQASAFGGSPAGLGESPDPVAILQKAQLLLKSGAITQQQYEMILAKIQGPGAAPGAAPGAPGAAKPPVTTTGMPGAGPPQGMPAPSPQWNL